VTVLVLGAWLLTETAPPVVRSSGLDGRVVDETGAALGGATVVLESLGGAVVRQAQSDAAGGFRLWAVPPGEYRMRVELLGFGSVTRGSVSVPGDPLGFRLRVVENP
jgi:hypothetical protein